MRKRQLRLLSVIGLLIGTSIVIYFGLKTFNENLLYFYAPQDVLENKPPQDRSFRLGGMVVINSVVRKDLNTKFKITDTLHTINVSYNGILPDLFREGQGVIVTGKMTDKQFKASEVLAKHDENYMPPEVADALQRAQQK